MDIGHRLKEIIKEHNILQKDLAAHIGVGSSYISGIIGGKKVPIDTLALICDYIGISLSEFFQPFSGDYDTAISPQISSLITQCRKLTDSQVKLLSSVASNFEQPFDGKEDEFALLPLLGSAAAGQPLNNGAFPDETIMVPSKYGDSTKYFGITVDGDSMSPHIKNGDYAIVLHDSIPETNDIVLVRGEGVSEVGYAIKKFRKNGKSVQFLSLNVNCPDLNIRQEDIISIEKVVHIIHTGK